jgi:hypothetical protein
MAAGCSSAAEDFWKHYKTHPFWLRNGQQPLTLMSGLPVKSFTNGKFRQVQAGFCQPIHINVSQILFAYYACQLPAGWPGIFKLLEIRNLSGILNKFEISGVKNHNAECLLGIQCCRQLVVPPLGCCFCFESNDSGFFHCSSFYGTCVFSHWPPPTAWHTAMPSITYCI